MASISFDRDQIKQYIVNNIDELVARADITINVDNVDQTMSGKFHYEIRADVAFEGIPMDYLDILKEDKDA